MSKSDLDERSREVLKALIQLHIATGEPVGSESLSRLLSRPLSPATLRNTMADLERQGYLDHPHTSAGRLPTDEGYRFYVDSLMSQASVAPRDAATIRSELGTHDGASSDRVMQNASQLLSKLSRNVGFVLAPDLARTTFRHIDLVRLPHPRILVVMVSLTGMVTNKIIDVSEELSPEELQQCANYLNANFAGMGLAAIRSRLLELMSADQALYDSLIRHVVSVGERAFASADEDGGVYLNGASNILDQAEFDDIPRMRTLFKTFEEKNRLVKILNACLSGDGVRIIIGHENPDPELRDMALVTARYALDGEPGFGLGVLGSTRMEYARVIALVDHVGRAVAQALAELRV
jgi:heat-inducible transcriptional repressor